MDITNKFIFAPFANIIYLYIYITYTSTYIVFYALRSLSMYFASSKINLYPYSITIYEQPKFIDIVRMIHGSSVTPSTATIACKFL